MVTDTESPSDLPKSWRWFVDEPGDPEDLPEDIAVMVDLIGRPATAKLLAAFAGMQVYFPSLKQAYSKYRAGRIRKEFTGANHRELARKYKLSVTHVYKELRSAPKK